AKQQTTRADKGMMVSPLFETDRQRAHAHSGLRRKGASVPVIIEVGQASLVTGIRPSRSRRIFVLPAVARDTNPKRERGRQAVPLLALRVSMDVASLAAGTMTPGAARFEGRCRCGDFQRTT